MSNSVENKCGIGIFGGSFDPPHAGHIKIAEEVFAQVNLKRIIFIPATTSPLKGHAPLVSGEHRLAMLTEALRGFSRFEIDDWELKMGGVNYSINTVRYLKEKWQDEQLYWIIGSDQLENLHRWHEIKKLAEMVHFICIVRPGHSVDVPKECSYATVNFVQTTPSDLSSSLVRKRIKEGEAVNDMLSEEVYRYIMKNSLYR